MPKKLQLHDAIGPFESRSNIEQLHDAHAAANRLKNEADRFWPEGTNDHNRWKRACDELQDCLNKVPSRQNAGDKLEDVLSDFIHEFGHSESRIVELLSRPDREADIRTSLEWLHIVFRAGIYGIIRTWLPRGRQEPGAVEVTIDVTRRKTTERWEYTPWQASRKYRKFKM